MWDRQLPEVAASYRVLRYDLRGHGSNPGNGPEHSGALTLQDLAGDLLTLLDEHGIDRVHFCGLSLGGLVGQWLGLHARDRLRTLTLVDSAPRMGSVQSWDARIGQIERDGMSSISEATMGRWFTEAFRRQQPAVVTHFKTVLENTSQAGYIACAKVVRDAGEEGDNLERFGAVQTPTLIATGSFDSAATPADCQRMASHIPGSRYVELAAAHISPIEAADAFTAAFLGFLAT
jgi:3-oxoadipate enol-lactonase